MADLTGNRGQSILAQDVASGVDEVEFEGQDNVGTVLANKVVSGATPQVIIGDLFPGVVAPAVLKFKARARFAGDSWGAWSPLKFFNLTAAPVPGDFIVVG
jgi:hypothetical protein